MHRDGYLRVLEVVLLRADEEHDSFVVHGGARALQNSGALRLWLTRALLHGDPYADV